jgi:hypothetical protein
MNEWKKLCELMGLTTVTPLSLVRLSRSPKSPHQDKPRLLKVIVSSEKDLENILLSAHTLRDGREDSCRVFADVPWTERYKNRSKSATSDNANAKSLILLGVPEATDTSMGESLSHHDAQQWGFISTVIGAHDVAVVDTFRIPNSPKYQGSGPRPLKLTLLTEGMAETIRIKWKQSAHYLPKYIRISSRVHRQQTIKTEILQVDIDADNVLNNTLKNAELPTLQGPAPILNI